MNSEREDKSEYAGESPSGPNTVGKNGDAAAYLMKHEFDANVTLRQPLHRLGVPWRVGAASSNVFWHQPAIRRADREAQSGHCSGVIWITGLSGAGKSTLAHAVEERLHRLGFRTYVLDGDNMRHALCGDLGFSAKDREENIRRAGEVAKLFVDAGVIVLTAFISPYRADRDRVRGMMADGDFLEIYCRCPLDVCEDRDVKGLYKRARAGEVKQFTGISSPYEEPLAPALVVDTTNPLGQCVEEVMALLSERWFRVAARREAHLKLDEGPTRSNAKGC